jgi:energy-coupling factor transporter ATP-binding protein EcfA2
VATFLPDTSYAYPETISREDFVSDYFDYGRGQHVTFVGPTGSGKTTLAQELIEPTATPQLPALVLVIKPEDEVVEKLFVKEAKFKRIKSWPPPPTDKLTKSRNGYVLWPEHSFDPVKDDPMLYKEMRRALLAGYANKIGNAKNVRGNILFSDEVWGLVDIGLKRELTTLWTRARAMGCGLWAASQRPALIPLAAYSEPEHLFIHYSPDKRARDRYKEIGGVDPRMIAEVTAELEWHQFLYINRVDRTYCVVDA